MTQDEIDEILKQHELWLRGNGGKRADLHDADLLYAVLRDADLARSNLFGANLRYADLTEANLAGANLADAVLVGANLADANLTGANLIEANLSRAKLIGANLTGAYLPAPTMVLLARWGECSDKTTVALMRLDASAHPEGPKAFDRWVESGECPYDDCQVQRVVNFKESRKLWAEHGWRNPPSLWRCMAMVLDEHCPGWRNDGDGGAR